MSARLRPWMVALTLCVLYLAVIFAASGANVSEFIRPRRTGEKGYDGQFTYFIALDPASASAKIEQLGDFPAYRFQRILHAALARLLALGQPEMIPWAMLAINLVALAAGTAALEELLVIEGAGRWYALTYGLFGGIFFAVRVNTTEPLAYGLVLVGMLMGARGRLNWQAVLLALAALAKETTLFFTMGYLAYFVLQRRWRDAIRLAIIALLPFAAWQVFLRLWLGQFGIGSGGALATPFEVIPFLGILRIGQESVTVMLLLSLFLIPAAVVPTLWALWRGGRDLLARRWHPYLFLLLVNAAIMPFVPSSTYREAFGLLRFLPGLVISMILYAALRRERRALRYSTIWVVFGLLLLG